MTACRFCLTEPDPGPIAPCCAHAFCAEWGHTTDDRGVHGERCSHCGDELRYCANEDCGEAFLPGEWDDPSLTHNDPDSNGRVHAEPCCRVCAPKVASS